MNGNLRIKLTEERQHLIKIIFNQKESLFIIKDKYLIDYKENMLGVFNFSNKKQNNVVKFITDKKIKNAQKINEFISVDDDISYNLYKNPMTENFHKFYEYIAEISDIKPFSLNIGSTTCSTPFDVSVIL